MPITADQTRAQTATPSILAQLSSRWMDLDKRRNQLSIPQLLDVYVEANRLLLYFTDHTRLLPSFMRFDMVGLPLHLPTFGNDPPTGDQQNLNVV